MKSIIFNFSEVAKKNKDKIAIVDNDGTRKITYEELDNLRKKVAGKLQSYNYPVGTRIAINIDRKMEYVAAYLGIQTAGYCTVMLNKTYPQERIDYILEDSASKLLINEDFFNDIEEYPMLNEIELDENTYQHITYTSGSTGKPKGVIHTVKSMYRNVLGKFNDYDIPGERLIHASIAPFSFIAYIFDVLKPLMNGGELHILSENIRKDAIKISEYYLEHKINHGVITAQLLKNCVFNSPYLKKVITGSEKVENIYSADYEIVSVYGSTETAIISSFVIDKKYSNTPIGKPFDSVEFKIINEENGRGELLVIGDLSIGYLNLEDKNKEKYETLPDGRIAYHTGDIVEKDKNGVYTYISRADWMVKINGQRVETLEVEQVIKELAVENAAVKSFTDKDGQNYLCAYYISNKINESDIVTYLNTKLPDYMIPRFFVKIDKMPLNGNGKLDRLALKEPSLEDYKKEYVKPENEIQKSVIECFENVLGIDHIGIKDDFFALGGDSIKILKLIDLIKKKTNLTTNPNNILKEKTVEKIVKSLVKEETTIEKIDIKLLPLSESQRNIYFDSINDPDGTKYNIPFMLRLPNDIDLKKLEKVIIEVTESHPALFATLKVIDGEPYLDPGIIKCHLDKKNYNTIKEAKDDFVKPFDLERGPLYRFTICKTKEDNILLFDVSHLVFDGTSIKVLLNQISNRYDDKNIFKEKLNQYDICNYELNLKESKLYQEGLTYFDKLFNGVDFDNSISPDKDLKEESSNIIKYSSWDTLSISKIVNYTRKLGITESTLFMGAFSYALSLYTGMKESNFVTVNDGRHFTGLQNSIGMFVKTIPLHFEIDDNIKISSYLENIGKTLYDSMKYDLVSFGTLASKYGINMNISFAYQADLLSEVKLGNNYILPEELPVSSCQSDILCMIIKKKNNYEISMHYRSNKYSKELIDSFANSIFNIINEMIDKEYLKDINICSKEDLNFINSNNSTDTNIDFTKNVLDIYKENYEESKLALVYKDKKYSYQEFNKIINNLAYYINNLGLTENEFVAVLAPRSDETVLSVFGIINSGCAFQVLDPTYPVDRLEYMINDTKAKLLIANRELANLLKDYQGNILYTDEFNKLEDHEYTANINTDNYITLIYTSGTTGLPKGSILTHKNLYAFISNNIELMNINHASRYANYASFGFDAGIMDMLSSICLGATLYIIPDEIRLDMEKLAEFYNENKITHGFMTTQVGRMFAENVKCPTLKSFMLGGEKLVPFIPQKDFKVFNCYGPCECICYITGHQVIDNSMIQPIGAPCKNVKLYVTDKLDRMLPVGGIGELLIAGPQVGYGYLNQEEKTKAVFVKNKFDSNKKYNRIYKTGDIVRLLTNGEIEFIGRRDGQVKIRGFRVELTEIEEVIRRYPGIKDATVVAKDNPSGGKYIVSYIVSDNEININDLNNFIKNEKPPYMVPEITMQIEAIPYNQNSKVNKRLLPEPIRNTNKISTNSVNTSKNIDKVREVVSNVLGHNDFNNDTNLYDVGLTSITTLKLNMELSKKFNMSFKTKDIKDNNTINLLTKYIFKEDNSIKEVNTNNNENIDKVREVVSNVLGHNDFDNDTNLYDIGLTSITTLKLNMELSKKFNMSFKTKDIKDNNTINLLTKYIFKEDNSITEEIKVAEEYYDLKDNQIGVVLESLNENSTKYNIPFLMKISKKIDLNKLKDAIIKAINNHSYIKSTLYIDQDNNYKLKRNDNKEVIINVINGELPKDIVKPFELIENNLYRINIYNGKKDNYLYIDIHHVLADGFSINILVNDINNYYLNKEVDKEILDGFTYSKEELNDSDYNKALEYYDKLLKNCNIDSLPGKNPERGDNYKVERTFEGKKIIDYCNKNNITLNGFFNAVFSYVLSRFLHQDDLTYCTIYNGRNDSRLYNTFDMLVKTLPIRTCLNYKDKVIDYIKNISNQIMDTMNNDIVSFSTLVNKYKIKSDIFLNYQGDNFNFNSLCGEDASIVNIENNDVKAKLSFEISLNNNNFNILSNYDNKLYCQELVNSLISSIIYASNEFIIKDILDDVSIYSKEEEIHFNKMNDTDMNWRKVPAQTLFEEYAKKDPTHIAVKSLNGNLTYQELDEKANIVANELIRLGLNKEIVGMVLDRDYRVPLVELAIMKAGCAFLPMLPTYPVERLAYCLKDSSSRYVISTKDIINDKKDLFKDGINAIDIDELVQGKDKKKPKIDIKMDDLVYCIYTSGSTGNPKGVMLEHHNHSNFLQTGNILNKMENGNIIFCMSSISFDMSITEIMYSLAHGKTIYIAKEEEIHNLDMLLEAFKKNKIDTLIMTPSFAWSLISIDEFKPVLRNLKCAQLGAEAFLPSLYNKLKELNSKMLIQNGYGPTECTQACSEKTITNGEEITIGGPFKNVKFYVMDDNNNLLPRYAVGELIIAGENVCRGYVNLPEKNKEAFININGLRGYKSGDLVRINRDNEVEFIGRKDSQVKLRGFRIELGEVESVMNSYPSVKQVKVLVKNNGTEDYLCGYFVADTKVDLNDLTNFMKTKLTYYMVPSAMMQLEVMPMTQNGKIDKKALPEIVIEKKEASTSNSSNSKIENDIINIYKEILKIDNITKNDNFFEIGGTSLSASKVVLKLKALGYKVIYQDLFDHQKVSELASFLNKDNPSTNNNKTENDIINIYKEILKVDNITKNDNFFEIGGTSLSASKVVLKLKALGYKVIYQDLFDHQKVSELASFLNKDNPEIIENSSISSKEENEFNDVLKHNVISELTDLKREELGDVFLTGATGFLGIHILKELIDTEKGKIICLVREKDLEVAKRKLKTMLMYYFEDTLDKYFDKRIILVSGDITEDGLVDKFKNIKFDTLINCAACVKHFASDNSIEFINVHGVENLIELNKSKNARMIQISTTSLPGIHTAETYQKNLRMAENELFVIDDTNNKYTKSKYQAERRMFTAISNGMRGKVIRAGNLMGRNSDGEFQINMNTNSFMQMIRAFTVVKKFPATNLTDKFSFSPIDLTAKVVVLLAGVNDKFTAFNADNRQTFDEYRAIKVLNKCGYKIDFTSKDEFHKEMDKLAKDEETAKKIEILTRYNGEDSHAVETDNTFTCNLLYRLGFEWPFMNDEYIEKIIKSVSSLNFFD